VLPADRPSLLFSYAYLRPLGAFADVVLALTDTCDVLIDSGAFTDYHAGKKAMAAGKKHQPITVEEYIVAARRFEAAHVYGYVALDKLMDREASRRNLALVHDAGLRPMPVFTEDEPLEAAPEFAAWNDYICVAGGGLSIIAQTHRYRAVADVIPGTRLHGLGFGRPPYIFQSKLFSGDVCTYANGSRFGQVKCFDREHGIITFSLGRCPAFRAKKSTDPAKARVFSYLMRCGFTAEMIRDPQTYYGKTDGMGGLTSAHAYALFQRHCATRGFKLYHAISSCLFLSLFAAVSQASRPDGSFDRVQAEQFYRHLNQRWKERNVAAYVGDAKAMFRRSFAA
jgi:hypothetical protein